MNKFGDNDNKSNNNNRNKRQIRDHCNYTGKYSTQAAHSLCN